MKKIFLFFLIINFTYSINGTITFYDGTTLDGELSSSDVRHVFITPEGLVMPEKIPVVDIDNFKLDNGIIMIEDGIAQQTYLDGKFSIIERDDEKEEYSSSKAEEYEEYDRVGCDRGELSSIQSLHNICIHCAQVLREQTRFYATALALGFGNEINSTFKLTIIRFGFIIMMRRKESGPPVLIILNQQGSTTFFDKRRKK